MDEIKAIRIKFFDNEIHPVRFTRKQIDFIKHMIINKGMEYWEEECQDILFTIENKK